MEKYYHQIDKALKSYENFEPFHERNLDWICHRIDWCWKWKKITEDQMIELSNRTVLILERRL